jgi:hypothetical protein
LKRIVSILLLLFYAGSICQAHVRLHYCGNKLASVSFTHNKVECGCGLIKNKKDDCCKDIEVKADSKIISTKPVNMQYNQPLIQVLLVPYHSFFTHATVPQILFAVQFFPEKWRQNTSYFILSHLSSVILCI